MKKRYTLRCKLLFLGLLLSGELSFGQSADTVKVLFIGNSFTSQNNLPALFTQLSQGANRNVLVAAHMPGGVSVGDTAQGTSAHMNNPLVYSLIKSDHWDYLVLQDNQGRFCLSYGQFPSSSLVIEGHLKIQDSLLFYNPCAHVIFYAGYGPKFGYPPYGNTGEALIDSIYQNYLFLNDTAKQVMAPIGPAFLRVMSGYPSINLWSSDDIHPSLYGSSLIADILYSTIFKSSPLNSSYNPGLSSLEDSLLKNLAFQTTMDSIEHSGLITITPQINQAGNTLFINGYSNCNWYLNTVPFLFNSTTAHINQSGVYSAIVIDSNNCEFTTLASNYLTTDISEYFNANLDGKFIYPNPIRSQNTLHLNHSFQEGAEVKFYNSTGELVLAMELKPYQNELSCSPLESGIYYLTLKSDHFFFTQKLVVEDNE